MSDTYNKGEWGEMLAKLSLLILPQHEKIRAEHDFKKFGFRNKGNMQELIGDDEREFKKLGFITKDKMQELSNDGERIVGKDLYSNISIPIETLVPLLNEASSKIMCPEVKGTFECLPIRHIMQLLHLDAVKSPKTKDDLQTTSSDNVVLGWTIKTTFAAKSSTINASNATNFIYEIQSNMDLSKYPLSRNPKLCTQQIKNIGGELKYLCISPCIPDIKKAEKYGDKLISTFQEQLCERKALIVGYFLEGYYSTKQRFVKEIIDTEYLGKNEVILMYGKKVEKVSADNAMTELLYDHSTRAVPSEERQMRENQAYGGKITLGNTIEDIKIDKDTGRGSHVNTLLENAIFDTPSVTRHHTGTVLIKQGSSIKLVNRTEPYTEKDALWVENTVKKLYEHKILEENKFYIFLNLLIKAN